MSLRLSLLLACVMCVLSASVASAQIDNSCTYQYSWTQSGTPSFSFCLTKYGTLASLKSYGNELLDPVNPVEGWTLYDANGELNFPSYEIIPGLGLASEGHNLNAVPAVSQPNGTGKLPIIFGWGFVTQTVTVDATLQSVVFKMAVPKEIAVTPDFVYSAGGPVERIAQLTDNTYFESTTNAAFGYTGAGGILLTGRDTSVSGFRQPMQTKPTRGCVIQVGTCSPSFFGKGTLVAVGSFSTYAHF